MKKCFKLLGLMLGVFSLCSLVLVGCGGDKTNCSNDLKLATYSNTEANYSVNNEGVKLDCVGDNEFELSGSVAVANSKLISDFGFKDNETHIVSLKLIANKEVEKDAFSLQIKGPTKTNTFDKASLDGDNYTYLLLAVDAMTDEKCYEITVKWNAEDNGTTYKICKNKDLTLKNN